MAIIMDGNGRWARQRGMERVFGHQEGAKAVRRVVEAAGRAGISYLTLYTFSTENWNRPAEEVNALMALLGKAIQNEVPDLMKNNVRLNAIGCLDDLPAQCREALEQAMDATSANTGMTLSLALSYSGRSELRNAFRKIGESVVNKEIMPDEITEQTIADHLYTASIPDPDVLIRTGGECRISNFLLWQLAYTEFFFLPVMWPDFSEQHLLSVLEQYQNRERRFGKTSDQVREIM